MNLSPANQDHAEVQRKSPDSQQEHHNQQIVHPSPRPPSPLRDEPQTPINTTPAPEQQQQQHQQQQDSHVVPAPTDDDSVTPRPLADYDASSTSVAIPNSSVLSAPSTAPPTAASSEAPPPTPLAPAADAEQTPQQQPNHALFYADNPQHADDGAPLPIGPPPHQRQQISPYIETAAVLQVATTPPAAGDAAAPATVAAVASTVSAGNMNPGASSNPEGAAAAPSSAVSLLPRPPPPPQGWAFLPKGAVLPAAAKAGKVPGPGVRVGAGPPPAILPIAVGSTFRTSKDLRLAVETSLMIYGRGLVCKMVGICVSYLSRACLCSWYFRFPSNNRLYTFRTAFVLG